MVFFNNLLPSELWFKIYKIEHSINLLNVNKEIKQLNKDRELINKNIILAIRFKDNRIKKLLYLINNIKKEINIPFYKKHLQIKNDIENKKLYNFYEFWNLIEFQNIKNISDKFSDFKFQLDEIKWYGFNLFL